MMRLLLAVLAVLALVGNPVNAAAGQRACAPAAQTNISTIDATHPVAAMAMDVSCCGQDQQQHKTPKICAQTCMSMSAAAVIPADAPGYVAVSAAGPTKTILALSPTAHRPTSLDPPPKLSA